ncbi:hypothetical protein MRX96_013925 [Rhipicephalus microplus]
MLHPAVRFLRRGAVVSPQPFHFVVTVFRYLLVVRLAWKPPLVERGYSHSVKTRCGGATKSCRVDRDVWIQRGPNRELGKVRDPTPSSEMQIFEPLSSLDVSQRGIVTGAHEYMRREDPHYIAFA